MPRQSDNVIDLRKARKTRDKRLASLNPASDTLPFIKRRKPRGTGFDYWSVKPTGRYEDDCATGRRLADQYLAFLGAHPTTGNATLLTCIVREMTERGEWSGVHVGFLAAVNRHAMAAACLEAGKAVRS